MLSPYFAFAVLTAIVGLVIVLARPAGWRLPGWLVPAEIGLLIGFAALPIGWGGWLGLAVAGVVAGAAAARYASWGRLAEAGLVLVGGGAVPAITLAHSYWNAVSDPAVTISGWDQLPLAACAGVAVFGAVLSLGGLADRSRGAPRT
jgi:hypothetical protein